MKDYYAILGISELATADEIKKAYRSKAKQYHPDVNASPNAQAMFIEISEAYEILMDPAARANYDRLFTNAQQHSTDNHRQQSEDYGQYQQAQRRAQQQASQYADISLDDLLEKVIGFAYEAGRTILVGERDRPSLNIFDYLKMGFLGVLLTICLILSFTGIGTVPGIAIGFLLIKSIFKNDRFIGIIPFILTTIVADIAVIIFLFSLLAGL